MTDYKELSKQLRYCGDVGKCESCEFDRKTEPCSPNLLGEAADAIEQLITDRDIFGELWFSCQEELKQAQAKLDKLNSLKHDDHYTGTYIKSLFK